MTWEETGKWRSRAECLCGAVRWRGAGGSGAAGIAIAATAAVPAAPATARTCWFPKTVSPPSASCAFRQARRRRQHGQLVSARPAGLRSIHAIPGLPGMVFVRASSLDDPEVFQPQMIVYSSRKPSWDHGGPEPAGLRGNAAAGRHAGDVSGAAPQAPAGGVVVRGAGQQFPDLLRPGLVGFEHRIDLLERARVAAAQLEGKDEVRRVADPEIGDAQAVANRPDSCRSRR